MTCQYEQDQRVVRVFSRTVVFVALFVTLFFVVPAMAERVYVAVAANFIGPAKAIAVEFEKETGHQAELSFGATGSFYAQIKHGAPFEVLLAADAELPAKLEQERIAVVGSRFAYAVGRLVLWSPKSGVVDERGEVLKKGGFAHLAVADAKLAPYGAAAQEALTALGLLERLRPKFVRGENIAQTHHFVASGNAELGFVALSQVVKGASATDGSMWMVPAHLYRPIRQEAVLLVRGRHNTAAQAWMDYLQGDQAKAVIRSFGYGF
ncbi:MAG: molybdate ABC transporter substrate-binding protein [Magnetococcales bacterium]|nr:molybdate ABC transporter substrate-binding protein [Magnetococcales bacterium]